MRTQLDITHGQLARLDFDPEPAYQLFESLLKPDWARLSQAKTVTFVSNGELARLPFSVLLTGAAQKLPTGAHAGYANLPWLVKQFAVAHAPSVGAFVSLRTAPSAKSDRLAMIGFGDPLFSNTRDSTGLRGISVRKIQYQKEADQLLVGLRGAGGEGNISASNAFLGATGAKFSSQQAFKSLSELPDTSEELRDIALALGADAGRDLYLRSKASEGELKKAKLDNRRVVVFATHGLVPGDVPGIDQAALALSNPLLTGESTEDGLLTMEEVLGLKLDADWVVLSACNTASSDGKDSEALSGLGRAFFFAGTRSLLVSNWAVETSSARKLTTELFRGESKFPGNRAEPLRQAMLSLMSATGASGAGESYSYAHPVFWAPFTLVGDPGRVDVRQ